MPTVPNPFWLVDPALGRADGSMQVAGKCAKLHYASGASRGSTSACPSQAFHVSARARNSHKWSSTRMLTHHLCSLVPNGPQPRGSGPLLYTVIFNQSSVILPAYLCPGVAFNSRFPKLWMRSIGVSFFFFKENLNFPCGASFSNAAFPI